MIRNFCIIAHIDHGKSTLADRMMEVTSTVEKREMREQLLDSMELEREKGITIKLQPVRMQHGDYQLNLIDTPGHVDFGYEVSRSLQACEGALLVVDATQGIQAQTLTNVYLAIEADLEIIPVLNKVDLPAADVDRVSKEVVNLLGCKPEEIMHASAKTGQGVPEIITAITERIPAPADNSADPLRALIFDSVYDDYRGVVLYARIFDGKLDKSAGIRMMAAGSDALALEVGHLSPKMQPDADLSCGEIGYIVTNLKGVEEARVGDTITLSKDPAESALDGYKEAKPFVYAGFFPSSSEDYQGLKEALARLRLNDAALAYEQESSQVLGHGFRVGFLGLLHMDIIRERLEREHGIDLIITKPSTEYEIDLINGEKVNIKNAADMPDVSQIDSISEPWIKGEVVCPNAYVGGVIQLITASRGMQKDVSYMTASTGDDNLATVAFEAPLANILTTFFDNLKSVTSGYGSFNYELDSYRPGDLVKLDYLVASEKVDALSSILHKSEADSVGREGVEKLKEVIPKQLFKVSLQAAIGSRILARDDLPALKKNVTGHLYGGDVSRKKKLWAKQKKGKERMKKFGKVDIPSDAFTALLKR